MHSANTRVPRVVFWDIRLTRADVCFHFGVSVPKTALVRL